MVNSRRGPSRFQLRARPIVPLAYRGRVVHLLPMFWFVAGLAWLAHIAIDHVAGYGMRAADGWQR